MEIAKIVLEYTKALIWPIVALTFLLCFHKEIKAILKNLKKLNLPGGTSVETFPEELKEAKTLSKEVKEEASPFTEKERGATIPLTEINTRLLNLKLIPSPSGLELSYYQNLAKKDPNLALAGLRMEAEIILKNLAKGFKLSLNDKIGTAVIAQKLHKTGKITSRQFDLISIIIKLCNSAVHGQKVTTKQANQLLDVAMVLVDDYIAWLSWGFGDGWKPSDK